MNSLSVIIPVYKETNINHLLNYLRKYFKGEIIVVDGENKASTLKLISDETIIKLKAPKGRGIQLHLGALKARGEILFFLHADTFPPPNFYQLICKHLKPPYGGGAFSLKIDTNHPWLKIVNKFANLRAKITKIPYGDQGIFVLRDLYFKVGGFPPYPIMEDVAFMQKLKAHYPICLLPEKIVTSARRWQKEGVFFTSLRNNFLLLLYFLKVKPEKLAKLYRPTYH